MKRKHKTYRKSKEQRRKWWFSLTPEQQGEYIKRRQAKKTKERAKMPKRVQKYDEKYPWVTEGVNESNREQWFSLILAKNPWLCYG